MLKEYAEILPDLAPRITSMAEREQQHRIDWGNRALDQSRQDTASRRWHDSVIGVASILGAVALAYRGSPWAATALVGGGGAATAIKT